MEHIPRCALLLLVMVSVGRLVQAQSSPADAQLHPPHIISAPPPAFPPNREGEAVHPTVFLRVTVTATADVTEIEVEHSAGADFDQAAIEAVRSWVFEPARRGDKPVASRVRIAVHFELPSFDVTTKREVPVPLLTEPADEVPPPDRGVEAQEEEPAAPEERKTAFGTKAIIDAELRSEDRSASDFKLDRKLIEAAPRLSAADILRSAPGLYVSQTEGPGVGHRVFLRGFDADHGQDIQFLVDGVPINQPSHIHGQGYTDINFIIPEAVQALRVIEGVYDPRQGDFAVAGTADFKLGVPERGLYSKSQVGNFKTFRQVAILAPKGQEPDTFGAFQFQRTDGFGQNRSGQGGSAIGQYSFGENDWRFRVNVLFSGSRFNSAGLLRLDDINAGEVGFYDAYPDATAQAQNAFNTRAQLGFTGSHLGKHKQNSTVQLWTQFYDFRLLANYTGYLERSQFNPDWVGRGDLIEQRDQRYVFGGLARHRTREYEPFDWARGTFEFGLSGRVDVIDQQQNLIQAPQNQTWDKRVDAAITASDIGFWLDADWHFSDYVDLKGGVRTDVLYYAVDDRLGNFIPEFREETFIPGFRRTALGIAVNPRVTLTVKPVKRFDILAAYGEGFRSPNARLLSEGEEAPFAKVRSADFGLRARVGKDEQLKLTLTGFYTKLNDDIAFDATEGRPERIGPTTRLGAVFYAVAQPWAWLTSSLSVTYVNATLDEPPPATREDPQPAFEDGQRIPFVPPWVVRLDIGAHGDLAEFGSYPLVGRLGLGYNYIGKRPLPFSQFADSFSLLDLSGSLSWRNFDLGVEIYNLLDKRYAADEFSFVSDWNVSAIPSRIPARHISAGAPRLFLFTLGVRI